MTNNTNNNNINLTNKQKAIVKKYAPKKIFGNSDDSFHNCVRKCAYEFCGGKDKYDADLYTLGKKAWFKAYNNEEYRKTCEDYVEETKADKPNKSARGSSRSTLESRVSALEKGLDEVKETNLSILAELKKLNKKK